MPLQPSGGGVELKALRAELGDALAQVTAGATALLALAVSRAEATRPKRAGQPAERRPRFMTFH
ncbi:MAG: hypothetical protein NTX16_11400, partial [Actinobacteria bacterium]|nr:hypothetical protein [Actinomycetota bacterium]